MPLLAATVCILLSPAYIENKKAWVLSHEPMLVAVGIETGFLESAFLCFVVLLLFFITSLALRCFPLKFMPIRKDAEEFGGVCLFPF